MAVTPRVELSAAMLAKDWFLDVDTGYPSGSETWTPVSGVMSFKPALNHTTKDVTTFDSGGAMSNQKTADQWVITMKLKRAPRAAALTSYDAGQEKLRVASNLYGANNLVKIRWYENNLNGPVTEAWQGVASCEWTEDSENPDDARVISVTLTGHGKRSAVTPNPASV
jgi:hypothetical protein